MNKVSLVAIAALFCGMVLGAVVVWRFAHNRGVSAHVRQKTRADLDYALVMAHRLRQTDATGVLFMLDLQIDGNILGLDEFRRLRALDEVEKKVFARALEYRRKNPFQPREYERDDGLMIKRIGQILREEGK